PAGDTFPHAIHLQRGEPDRNGEVLLVAEILRGERDPLPLRQSRAFVVRQLIGALPFLERHLLAVDSVHDGLPVWCYGDGRRPREVERSVLAPTAPRIE